MSIGQGKIFVKNLQLIMEFYAHRAGRGLGPENTLEACDISLQFPIDFIDFDVCMSLEGELVVTHDLTLNPDIVRAPEGPFITEKLLVCEMPYHELATYNVGMINPSSRYASYFPAQRSFPFARMPLLKEAIAYVHKKSPSMKFQIELKSAPSQPHLCPPPEKLALALVETLSKMGIVDWTEVQSFDYRCLLEIQQLDPRIKTTYLTTPSDYGGYDLQQYGGSHPRLIKAMGGACWGPFQMDLTHENFLEAKELGLKVVPWGCPELEGTDFNARQIHKLISWGIDGMIIDRPDRIDQDRLIDPLKR